jgi:hypothetical protein
MTRQSGSSRGHYGACAKPEPAAANSAALFPGRFFEEVSATKAHRPWSRTRARVGRDGGNVSQLYRQAASFG